MKNRGFTLVELVVSVAFVISVSAICFIVYLIAHYLP